MPATYRIIYTVRSAQELEKIFSYIERDSSRNARTMIERLLRAIDSLETLPHRYAVGKNANKVGEEIRSMPVRPYLVRYHVDDVRLAVTILSVRHGAREPDT